MISESVIYYVSTLYGILLGVFFPLIYLYSKSYFRKNRFGFRVMLKYLGRLLIIIFLFVLITNSLLMSVGRFGDPESINRIIESLWYIIGFLIGLIGGVFLCIYGLRQARKSGQSD